MNCVGAVGPLLVSLRTMVRLGFLVAVQRIIRCVWSPIYFCLMGAQTLASELPIGSLPLGSVSTCVVHRSCSGFGGLLSEFATHSVVHVSWGN